MAKLLLLFIVLPLVEIYVLVQIGGVIGFWSTIWLIILTGVIGFALARLEGLRVWREWQLALEQGRMPEDGVLSGLLLLVGGLLLIAPGVLSDAVGLLLLIPRSRRLVAAWLRPWLEQKISAGAARARPQQPRVRVVRLETDLLGNRPFVSEPFGHQPYGYQAGAEPAVRSAARLVTCDPVAQLRRQLRSARTESSKQPQVIDVDFEVTDVDRID